MTTGSTPTAPTAGANSSSTKSEIPSELSPFGKDAQSLQYSIGHYPQTVLRWVGDKGAMARSQVLLCQQGPTCDAIIFVHGFGGAGTATWEIFPQIVGTIAEASKADAFFIDYPSKTHSVAFCAALIRTFLFDLVRDPVYRIIQPSLPANAPNRARDERYRRVIIVAHSMGAVITRRAVMDFERLSAITFSDDELSKFCLLFFAPAHCGSDIPLLIASGFGLDGVKPLGLAARKFYPSLRDLEEGSPALIKLAEDCRRLREERTQRGLSTYHLCATVYHAQNDRVVSQNDFDHDPPFEPVMGKNHRSICKPKSLLYVDPVEALRAVLSP